VQLPNEEKPFPVGERTKREDLRRPGVNSCCDRALEARGEARVESEDSPCSRGGGRVRSEAGFYGSSRLVLTLFKRSDTWD
jgi:hypothetical protein